MNTSENKTQRQKHEQLADASLGWDTNHGAIRSHRGASSWQLRQVPVNSRELGPRDTCPTDRQAQPKTKKSPPRTISWSSSAGALAATDSRATLSPISLFDVLLPLGHVNGGTTRCSTSSALLLSPALWQNEICRAGLGFAGTCHPTVDFSFSVSCRQSFLGGAGRISRREEAQERKLCSGQV